MPEDVRARLMVVLSGSSLWVDLLRDVGRHTTVVGALLDDRIAPEFSRAHPESDVLLGNDLKFGLFDRVQCLPTPSHIKLSASYLLRERQAHYSMQRLEVGGSIEFPVRDHYLSSMTDYLWAFLEAQQPTHMVMSEAPHTPECLLLAGLFEAMGRPVLQFEQCGILPRARFSIWPDYTDFLPTVRERVPLNEGEQSVLRDVLEQFDSGERTNVESSRLRRERRFYSGPRGLVRRFFIPFSMRRDEQVQAEDFFSGGERLSHPPTLHSMKPPIRTLRQVVWPSFCMLVQQWRQLRRIRLDRKSGELPTGPFATYFLHFEPERTSMPDGGVFSDQLFAVRSIAASLDDRLPLVVVEHPSQAGLALRGFRTRRHHFYDEIKAIPGVTLVCRDVSREEIFSSSRLVVTLTGTVALEATRRGIPTLCLGYPWYRGMDGITLCHTPEELPRMVSACLSYTAPAVSNFEQTLTELLEREFLPMILNPSNRHRFDETAPALDEARHVLQEFLRREKPESVR